MNENMKQTAGFSCAKRAAEPANEFAACAKWCGDAEKCVHGASDASKEAIRLLTVTIRRMLNLPDASVHRLAEVLQSVRSEFESGKIAIAERALAAPTVAGAVLSDSEIDDLWMSVMNDPERKQVAQIEFARTLLMHPKPVENECEEHIVISAPHCPICMMKERDALRAEVETLKSKIHFANEAELIAFLDGLHVCDAGGTITNEKMPAAQRAIFAIRSIPSDWKAKALRQYMHNDGSGLVFGYDTEIIDRLFAASPVAVEQERFYMDHGLWHDRVTGQHMWTQDQYDEAYRDGLAVGRENAEIATHDAAPAQEAAVQADSLDAGAAKRLRLICKLVGLESAVPESDADLWGCAFSVLGMIRSALQSQAPLYAAAQAIKTTALPEALTAGVPPQDGDLGQKIRAALEASGALVGMTFFHIDREKSGPHMEAIRNGLGAAYEIWKRSTTGDAAIGEKGNG